MVTLTSIQKNAHTHLFIHHIYIHNTIYAFYVCVYVYAHVNTRVLVHHYK